MRTAGELAAREAVDGAGSEVPGAVGAAAPGPGAAPEAAVVGAGAVELWPQCDCGYRCQGDSTTERVDDARRHARQAHGIDVTVAQVLEEGQHP